MLNLRIICGVILISILATHAIAQEPEQKMQKLSLSELMQEANQALKLRLAWMQEANQVLKLRLAWMQDAIQAVQ